MSAVALYGSGSGQHYASSTSSAVTLRTEANALSLASGSSRDVSVLSSGGSFKSVAPPPPTTVSDGYTGIGQNTENGILSALGGVLGAVFGGPLGFFLGATQTYQTYNSTRQSGVSAYEMQLAYYNAQRQEEARIYSSELLNEHIRAQTSRLQTEEDQVRKTHETHRALTIDNHHIKNFCLLVGVSLTSALVFNNLSNSCSSNQTIASCWISPLMYLASVCATVCSAAMLGFHVVSQRLPMSNQSA